jgi:hypothetical protein
MDYHSKLSSEMEIVNVVSDNQVTSVVSMLAIGPKVCGFKPSPGDGFLGQ